MALSTGIWNIRPSIWIRAHCPPCRSNCIEESLGRSIRVWSAEHARPEAITAHGVRMVDR